MSPEQYQSVQDEFLALREVEVSVQNKRLAELRTSSPDIAQQVQLLLAADESAESFLEAPLISRKSAPLLQTTDIRSAPAVDEDDLPDHIGPYRILQKIGEGGHGVVFMAEQMQPLRRRVALKCIKPGMDSNMILARFEAERQALAMMSHPSIANVIDAGSTDSGQPYFVMELVHGMPIDQFCTENELNLDERLNLFRQVCEAVHHAHRKGVIHRDIKPMNVLVTVESGKPLAKVIDFGIAKALHMPLTERTMFTEYGQVIGTLEYMSPEQALMSQSGIDVRSDVYSLGVLLYLLITGETPLSRNELLKQGIWELQKVLRDAVPATPSLRITSGNSALRWRDHSQTPEKWAASVKGDLDWVTMKALAREPEQRYDSAAALGADVINFQQGDSVIARPPSLMYSFRKFVRRNRVTAVIASAVGVSVIVSVLSLAWGYMQSQRNLVNTIAAQSLLREKAEALNSALLTAQSERRRADSNAARLSGMLQKQIVESAWNSARDGDAQAAMSEFADIPDAEREFEHRFVEAAATHFELPVIRRNSSGPIRNFAIHQKSGLAAITTTKSVLEVHDYNNNRLLADVPIPARIPTAIAFSADGQSVLLAGDGATLSLIDWRSGRQVAEQTPGKGGIRSIACDKANHRWLVTTGANYVVALDADDLRVISSTLLPNRITSVAVAPDGSAVFVSGVDGKLFVAQGDQLHDFHVRTLPNGNGTEILAFGWHSGVVWMVDVAGQVTWTSPDASQTDQFVVAIGRIERQLSTAAVGEFGRVYFADLDGQLGTWVPDTRSSIVSDTNKAETPNVQTKLRTFSKPVRHLAFDTITGKLLFGHTAGQVSSLNQSFFERATRQLDPIRNIADSVVVESQQAIITAHSDGELRTWNSTTWLPVKQKTVHNASVYEMDVHVQQNLIASIGADRRLVISGLSDLKPVHELSISWGVRCAAFSHDGRLLASAADASNPEQSREGTVDIWSVETGQVIQRLSGHTNWVTGTVFAAEDDRVVTMSVDGTLKVWAVVDGMCLQTIRISSAGNSTALALSNDGRRAFTGHEDGTVCAWDLVTGSQSSIKVGGSGSVLGICVPSNSDRIVVGNAASPLVDILDASSLKPIASLDAGIGKLVAMKTNDGRSSISVIGENGIPALLPIPE